MQGTAERTWPASHHADVWSEVIAAARVAWPTVALANERFVGYLRERLPAGIELEAALRQLHTSDLYLACACADGDPGALAAFDDHCLSIVDLALRRLRMDADAISEVKQRLRGTLLVAERGSPRIAGFAGRGDLRRWIRVLAVHEAFAVLRHARRHVAPDEDRLVELVARGASPELDYIKRVYRREFELALREGIQALSDRERTLIRQHFLDGVTIFQLARLHRVHRVTAGRWLEAARDTILATTRARLVTRLDVAPGEIESIIRLVLSQLELSLRPLFRRPR